MQNITRLPNDGELILTWSRFHAPSGYALDDLGVLPNVCTSTMAPTVTDNLYGGVLKAIGEATTTLSVWRTVTGFESKLRGGLRAKCPKKTSAPRLDLEIAREILFDRRLYARSLGMSAPRLAKDKGTETVAN